MYCSVECFSQAGPQEGLQSPRNVEYRPNRRTNVDDLLRTLWRSLATDEELQHSARIVIGERSSALSPLNRFQL